jgi:hypothetical protein
MPYSPAIHHRYPQIELDTFNYIDFPLAEIAKSLKSFLAKIRAVFPTYLPHYYPTIAPLAPLFHTKY